MAFTIPLQNSGGAGGGRGIPTGVPANTVAPSVLGIRTVGQTLSASVGTWTNFPTAYTYQWKKNGTNISGATSSTYVPVTGDGGGPSITVAVNASNPEFGAGTAVTSAGVTIAAVLAISGTPGAATNGTPYTFTPTATGGHTTYVFSLTGTLPTGLSFNTATGAITGTPTVDGTTSGLNITVTDADGLTAALGAFSLVVGASSGTASADFSNPANSQYIALLLEDI